MFDKAESIAKIAASVFAVLVSLILLSGYSYYLGYTNVFDLSSDLISKSMADVLAESWYVGVMAFVWLLLKWPYVLGSFVFFLILFSMMFFLARWARENGKDWMLEETTKENQGRHILGITVWHWKQLGGLFYEVVNWFYYPIAIIVGIGSFAILPYQTANDSAKEQKELFEKNGCSEITKKYSCIYLVDIENQQKKILAKGILISANDKRVAIYNNKLEIWPLLDNYIIRKNTDVGWVEQSETQQNHSPKED